MKKKTSIRTPPFSLRHLNDTYNWDLIMTSYKVLKSFWITAGEIVEIFSPSHPSTFVRIRSDSELHRLSKI